MLIKQWNNSIQLAIFGLTPQASENTFNEAGKTVQNFN